MASFGDVDRNVTITFIGRDNASRAMNSIGSSANKTTTTVGRLTAFLKRAAVVAATALAAAAGVAAYAIYNLGKQSIESASTLNESINAVKVTWGKASGEILNLSKKAAEGMGLAKSEFNAIAVQFSSFSNTIAGKGGDATEVLADLTQRGADFASVMNLDVNEALRLFQSGLAGETEPLRKFGIDLSAASVAAYAVKKGIAESAATMTEAQKVQARYALLMKSTNKAAGDFKNTSGELANKQRILNANWENAKAAIGKALLPIMTKLVTYLNDEVVPVVRKKVVPAVKDLAKWIDENGDTIRSWGEMLKAAWIVVAGITKAVVDFFQAIGKLNKSLQTLFGFDVSFLIQMKVAVLTLQHPLTAISLIFSTITNKISNLVYWVDRFISRIYALISAMAKIPSFDLPGIPGLAAGGYVDQRAFGGWTMVGEHGPELISNRGFVKPHSASMGGGGGGNVYVTVQGAIDPVGTARQIRNILAKGDRAGGRAALGLA